jgi:endonuclease/exonuclease/phosphatase family metal-dependent hydrolase
MGAQSRIRKIASWNTWIRHAPPVQDRSGTWLEVSELNTVSRLELGDFEDRPKSETYRCGPVSGKNVTLAFMDDIGERPPKKESSFFSLLLIGCSALKA